MMMMSELPGDLLEEILCRVPATSLKQLRSTCKRWNCLFNDRRFTIKHFHKSTKQSLILMLKKFRFHSMSINLHKSPPVEFTCELNLIHPHSSLDQICQVFHCEGLLLLLCRTSEENTRLVVWNPCTGQTRWINHYKRYASYAYALGSYQDKKSNYISYKILSCRVYGQKQEFKIYEINSNSWKILDVTLDFKLDFYHRGVFLKGKTYWIARDEKVFGKFLLLSFDYTAERFERLCLPRHYQTDLSLSVVREEKLSVLLQCKITSKTEIWVTNKISETKAMSWSKVLAVDLDPGFVAWYGVSFVFDEEKKVLVCCDGFQYETKNKVYIVGEGNKVRKVDFEVGSSLFNYVPSLIQI